MYSPILLTLSLFRCTTSISYLLLPKCSCSCVQRCCTLLNLNLNPLGIFRIHFVSHIPYFLTLHFTWYFSLFSILFIFYICIYILSLSFLLCLLMSTWESCNTLLFALAKCIHCTYIHICISTQLFENCCCFYFGKCLYCSCQFFVSLFVLWLLISTYFYRYICMYIHMSIMYCMCLYVCTCSKLENYF